MGDVEPRTIRSSVRLLNSGSSNPGALAGPLCGRSLMQGSTKEARLTQTFVDLVDTLVDDFDVVDLLTLVADRCVEILDIAAAGLMLVAPEGDLRVVAFSSEAVRVVELFELQAEEGPCLDTYRSGAAIVNQDLTADPVRWP